MPSSETNLIRILFEENSRLRVQNSYIQRSIEDLQRRLAEIEKVISTFETEL